MNISDEAVEAAARVLVLAGNIWTPSDWDEDFGIDPDDPEPNWKDGFRETARAALESAAPHLMASVWDQGRVDGYHHRPNPYKSAGAGE